MPGRVDARSVGRMCTYRASSPPVADQSERFADPSERIGDDERERASTELRSHFAAGRLDVDEFSARLEEVWAARTRGDVNRTLRDMPRPEVVAYRPAYRPARHHRRPRLFLPVAAILLGVWLLAHPGRPFLPIWPLVIWATIVLLIRHRRRSWELNGPPAAAPR
jgi:hypothetical protein